MNIAIFGGSFDPPHIGHEEIIKTALAKLDIDILFVVPTFLNPFKKTFFAPAKKRYKWIKKLLLSYPKAKVLDYEIKQNHPVPTIQTVKYLLKNFDIDKIYLIIGADNLPKLDKWKDFKELQKLVHFVVASRDKEFIPKDLQKLDIHVSISSTKLRDKIEKKYLPKTIADEVMEYYEQKS
jgi:nicotinate-nucleotide adenylyltransferase